MSPISSEDGVGSLSHTNIRTGKHPLGLDREGETIIYFSNLHLVECDHNISTSLYEVHDRVFLAQRAVWWWECRFWTHSRRSTKDSKLDNVCILQLPLSNVKTHQCHTTTTIHKCEQYNQKNNFWQDAHVQNPNGLLFLLKTMCWDGSLGLICQSWSLWLQHCTFWDRGSVLLWVARTSERGLEKLKDALRKHGFSLRHYSLDSIFFQLLLWCKVCFHICILERNSSWKKHIITNATCYIASVFLYERSRLHLESNVCQTTWLLNVSVANMQQSYPGAPRAGFTSH